MPSGHCFSEIDHNGHVLILDKIDDDEGYVTIRDPYMVGWLM